MTGTITIEIDNIIKEYLKMMGTIIIETEDITKEVSQTLPELCL